MKPGSIAEALSRDEERPWPEMLPGHRLNGLLNGKDVLVLDAYGPLLRVQVIEQQASPKSALFYREVPTGRVFIVNLVAGRVIAEDAGVWKPPDDDPREKEPSLEPAAKRRL